MTHDAFRIALAQGRGAALMHVLAHGLAGVDQLVLTACLEHQAYDRQCEELRAPWLYRMFKNAPEYDMFRRRIIVELLDMSEDSSAEQLCDLAALMALDGDEEAKGALRTCVWRQDFAVDNAGCHAIASVDGRAAVRAGMGGFYWRSPRHSGCIRLTASSITSRPGQTPLPTWHNWRKAMRLLPRMCGTSSRTWTGKLPMQRQGWQRRWREDSGMQCTFSPDFP